MRAEPNQTLPTSYQLTGVINAALSRANYKRKYIAEFDVNGDTVLLCSARHGRLESVQYLREHVSATITETNNGAMTV